MIEEQATELYGLIEVTFRVTQKDPEESFSNVFNNSEFKPEHPLIVKVEFTGSTHGEDGEHGVCYFDAEISLKQALTAEEISTTVNDLSYVFDNHVVDAKVSRLKASNLGVWNLDKLIDERNKST